MRIPLRFALGGLLLVAVLVLGRAVPATHAPHPALAQSPAGDQHVATFEYTGAAQTWQAPGSVHHATFTVSGAQGGGTSSGYDGGGGGQATATLAVVPFAVYTIGVGGAGGDGTTTGPGAGGFNGGADGGCPISGVGGGAGGGGASTVSHPDLTNHMLIAGGGGGAGQNGDGGAGGGLVGGAGADNAGGTGGSGGNQDGSSGSGRHDTGSPGQGCGGGGGGGGYYGGAGGGAQGFAAAAGGGSGHGPAGVQFQTGVQPGNGLVTVTYDTATPAPASPPPAQPMTITGRVHRIVPPIVSENQIAEQVIPVGDATVEALVGSTTCGTALTDRDGRFQLTVAAHPAPSGCGRPGATISLRVNGAATGDTLPFQSGGSATVELRLSDRSVPPPLGWP